MQKRCGATFARESREQASTHWQQPLCLSGTHIHPQLFLPPVCSLVFALAKKSDDLPTFKVKAPRTTLPWHACHAISAAAIGMGSGQRASMADWVGFSLFFTVSGVLPRVGVFLTRKKDPRLGEGIFSGSHEMDPSLETPCAKHERG